MMKKYEFEIAGTAAGDQTWSLDGAVESEWTGVIDVIMRDTFEKLTQGRAVYGKPGVGCRGPYAVTRLVVELAN